MRSLNGGKARSKKRSDSEKETDPSAKDVNEFFRIITDASLDPDFIIILPGPVDILPDGTIVPRPPVDDQKDKD